MAGNCCIDERKLSKGRKATFYLLVVYKYA